MTPEQAQALRAPFAANQIGKLPKAGIKLDYVGHAGVTDRLLQVDPEWTWEPAATDQFGAPALTNGGLWIKLTVCGVTRYGWGDGPDIKQMISDAIRNAAMRFGVALDLWSKEDLHAAEGSGSAPPAHAPNAASGAGPVASAPENAGSTPATASVSKARREKLKSRCMALQADGISVAGEREALHLPLVDSCNVDQITIFEQLVSDLEAKLAAPFAEATS